VKRRNIRCVCYWDTQQLITRNMFKHNLMEFNRIGNRKKVFQSVRQHGRETSTEPDVDRALKLNYDLEPLQQDTSWSCLFKAKSRSRHVDTINLPPYNGSKFKSLDPTSSVHTDVAAMKNFLIYGSYRQGCKDPKYDPVADELTCWIQGKLLSLTISFRMY
jgi:hypothetical protein